MCGIFGISGNKNVIPQTIKGIKKLEYRGYDSSGIAYFEQETIKNIKKVGEISVLDDVIKTIKPASACAISHTRWATHGKPSDLNAHPHASINNDFVLVHNGIIENYIDLKNKYLKNVTLSSSTDSEVVSQLLYVFYDGNVLNTIKKVCSLIKGSYALGIITKHEPGVIYATKKDSPLIVASGPDGGIIASDISAVLEYTKKPYIMNNYEYAKIAQNNISFYDKELNEITKKTTEISDFNAQVYKNKYKHFMLKEIHEIPSVINNLLKVYSSPNDIYKCIPKEVLQNTKHITFVACGTAYHAGLIGKNLIEKMTNINVSCEIASEFRYSKATFNKESLYIFVTQSGETADTLAALKKCKEQGAKTLSVVNVKNSSITYESDYNLYTLAGIEVGVASTKAYNSQVALLYLLTHAIVESKTKDTSGLVYGKCLADISSIFAQPNLIKKLSKNIKTLANKYKNAKSVYMIGRQLDYLTSQEAALKLKEISYIHCETYAAGELKHGTISLIEQGTLVVCFITQAFISEKTLNAIHEVKSRGANVLLVTNQDKTQFKNNYDNIINLPKIDDFYAPLISIIPLQLLSYYTSLALGYNPDKPRNLAKSVTVE